MGPFMGGPASPASAMAPPPVPWEEPPLPEPPDEPPLPPCATELPPAATDESAVLVTEDAPPLPVVVVAAMLPVVPVPLTPPVVGDETKFLMKRTVSVSPLPHPARTARAAKRSIVWLIVFSM